MGQRFIINEDEKRHIKSLYEYGSVNVEKDDKKFWDSIFKELEREKEDERQEYLDSLSDEDFYRKVKRGDIILNRDPDDTNYRRWSKMIARKIDSIKF